MSQASVFLCAVRLVFMVTAWGKRLPWLAAYRIHLKSLFYFVFVPFSIGADVAKMAMFSSVFQQRKAQIIGMVFSDRVVGFLTFLVLSLLAFVHNAHALAALVGISRGYVLVLLGLLLLAAVGSLLLRTDRLGIGEKMAAFWAAFRNASWWVCGAFGTSILMQLCMCTAVFMAAASFAIPIHWLQVVFVVSSAMLFQLIPVSVGGVGVTEVAAVGLYMAVGLGRTDAILLASTAYTFKLLSALIGGLLEYVETLRGGKATALDPSRVRGI